MKMAGDRFGLIRGRLVGTCRRAFWNASHVARLEPLHSNWATIFSLDMLIPLTPAASFSRNRLGLCEPPSPITFGMRPSGSSGG